MMKKIFNILSNKLAVFFLYKLLIFVCVLY
uniref:Uncharacterized protein n=1 Tax=Timema bartmani TaxID=61472 RepID=A0A7R9IAT0_9NEOP|nr:unnamed protein product [Timema bartmani]